MVSRRRALHAATAPEHPCDGSMPPLRHGHVHQHFDLIRTQVTTVWPAPDGLWHVGVNASEPHATTKPVTEEELGRLLQEWGVEVDRWVSWLDSDLWTMPSHWRCTPEGGVMSPAGTVYRREDVRCWSIR